MTEARLAEIFLDLRQQGALNLNLVTGVHFIPSICAALDLARAKGFDLPVVYNSSGYENPEALSKLEGYVDIYLPDYKYAREELAASLSAAPDYPEAALAAIDEMVRQTGPCVFDGDGMLKRGTLIRHLVLPGHTRNSLEVIDRISERWRSKAYISLMNQYTPLNPVPGFPELSRRVTAREYDKVLSYALEKGLSNGFFQEGPTSEESFIPDFDLTGVE